MSQTATDSTQVKLRKGGELTITEDGQRTVVAKYDEKTGHLAFTTQKYSETFYNACVSCIGSVGDGKEVSGKTIRSIGVGDEKPKPLAKDAPKRPKLGPLGDSAEEVVQWYLDYDLPQAIIRYGIYVDEKGNPIRKKVRRVFENIVDNREVPDMDIVARKDSPNSQVKSPVVAEREAIEVKDGIIARRGTALTYTPSEVVGGWQPDDDENYQNAGGDEE
jgi:hypothetical protein